LGTWSIIAEIKRKRMSVPQNRFKVLSSRVMRCGVEMRKQKEEKKEGNVRGPLNR